MLFDAHVHFFSRAFYRFYAEAAKVPMEVVAEKTGAEVPADDDPGKLAARWLAELDRHQVDRAVLIASVPGDEGSVAQAVRLHPDRFRGYFLLNPKAPEPLDRARRGLDAGLSGVCLFPAMHHFYSDDEALEPLFAELEAREAVAFVHFGLLMVPIREKLGLPPSIDLKYSHPHRLHAVANRHPRLSFVVPHFGCGFLTETLMLGRQTKNVHLDTSSSNSWMELFSGLDLKRVFALALSFFGPRRILFGTDSSAFPRGWRRDLCDRQRQALADLDLAPQDRDALFGGNLAGLLGVAR
jgi:predicted TIM-barrel fold metal-dependent hydrolase